MKGFSNLWREKFDRSGRDPLPEPDSERPSTARSEESPIAEWLPGVPYKKGDIIGEKYEVEGILGVGGFGVVYLVYLHQTTLLYALKTFRDEYLTSQVVKERFRREAHVWIDLDRHPYLVRAHFVDEVSGRLYIGTEYIAPNEQGLNSLEGYLQRRPPDLAQCLRWSIQLCYGMEYSYSMGVRCHRDIKPANILISDDGVVKITDFGLAAALTDYGATRGVQSDLRPGKVGLSWQTVEGAGCGTPTHMPPEQFVDAINCDERSDIYSYGIVLFQMVSGGKLPFLPPMPKNFSEKEKELFWHRAYELHRGSPVPRLNSHVFAVIQRCLEKDPGKRYQTFRLLRSDLEPLLKRLTGEVIRPPESNEFEVWEWGNKGLSLDRLGRVGEAIRCYDHALALDPTNVLAWTYKGNSYCHQGQDEEGIRFYDRALVLDPMNVVAWGNKGIALVKLRRYDEAIRCYDQVLELDPKEAWVWQGKADCLSYLERFQEAIRCYDQALVLNPQSVTSLAGTGRCFLSLGGFEKAIRCYDQALALDPRDSETWKDKGYCLCGLGRLQEAIGCFDKSLEINPQSGWAWNSKGMSLYGLGRCEEAIYCYNMALEIEPGHAEAWHNKGLAHWGLGEYEEAVTCYEKALEFDPQNGAAWRQKGDGLVKLYWSRKVDRKEGGPVGLSSLEEAVRCYEMALAIDPQNAVVWSSKGYILNLTGRYAEAAQCYDQALELEPQDAWRWSEKGYSLQHLGRNEEAISCFDKSLQLSPGSPRAWTNKGRSLCDLGRFEEAVLCYDKALELDPGDLQAIIGRSSAKARTNRG